MSEPINFVFEPINLDCLTIDPSELQDVADRLQGLSDALRNLSMYAKSKARAMEFRNAGNITTALKLERYCDAVFVLLPDWAKW